MKRLYILLLAIFTLTIACEKSQYSLDLPKKPQIFGLASPIKLKPYVTTVYLSDYFPDTKVIDSTGRIPGIDIIPMNRDWILLFKIQNPDSLQWLSKLDVWAGGYKYSIPVFKSTKIKYSFKFKVKGKKFKSVQIRGEMTNWQAKNLAYFAADSSWNCGFTLEPGQYQYLLIIDGKEQLDPTNPNKSPNGFGGYNSVLKVGHAQPDSVPQLFTKSFNHNQITIGIKNHITQAQVYFENFALDSPFVQITDTTIKIHIPNNAKHYNLAYLRVYAANDYGFSNDILIPLHKGKPVTDPKLLPRDDFHAAVIYNLMVDRFYNGNHKNDPEPLDSVLPPAQYHGGDLQGILTVLKTGYFDTLGVNTLWISPIVQNVKGAWGLWKNPRTKFSAYHGYWPVSLTKIDSRLGDSASLVQLVNHLHNENKNLLLDFVAHHVHKNYWLYRKHPEYFTSLYLPDGRLNTELWDEQRLTTWFDVFLPTFNTALPKIYNMIADSAVWWIKTYNLDGFRHDAAKHVHLELWRALTRKLKLQVEIPQNRHVYQIGETYGTPELIASYLGSGLLDGQFDFNVYDKLKAAIAGGQSFKDLQKELDKSFKYYGWHNLMGYITGNQDQGRIISYVSGQIPLNVWGNDLKAIGWQNPPKQVTDFKAYKKVSLIFAFINTIPGVPVIYYGDEIGLPGAGDPDNRRDMKFGGLSKEQLWLRTNAAKLIHLRRSLMPLIYGDFQWIYVDDDLMVYSRRYFDKIAIVFLNKSDKSIYKTFNIDKDLSNSDLQTSGFGGILARSGHQIKVEVQANSYFIVYN